MSIKGFMGRSRTMWETSHYGGPHKVLYDLPDMNIPPNIYYSAMKDAKCDLSYYSKQKLMDLFFLRASEHNLSARLIVGAEERAVERYSYYTKKIELTEASIRMVCNMLIDKDPETGSLFELYHKYICNHSITISFGTPTEEMVSDVPTTCIDIIGRSKVREKYSYADYTQKLSTVETRFIKERETKSASFSESVIKSSDKLVKLLDISFDPKEDKIKNLRSGKLDISKLGEIPAGNINAYYRVEENQTTKPFSICILGDESGSMEYGTRISAQIEMIKILYKAFSQIIPQDKIYIYGHSGGYSSEIYVYQDKYNPTFEATINNMKARHENYDGPAIEAVHKKVREQTSDNIIFISISDGEPAGMHYGGWRAIIEMKKVIEKCKRDGFVTCGVGIDYGQVKDIYKYNTVVTDMSKAAEQVSSLVNSVVKREFQ